MICRIIVWVRDGALRPTAVDRPWASNTFQTGNSGTSYFLSGRFLHKTMLQKARRGKEINRGVVDQPFSHLYFSAKWKRPKAAIVHSHCTCHKQRAMSKLNKRAGTGYHLSSDFFDSLQRAEKVFNLRGFSQVNSTWKKWKSTRCCNRLDNKKIPCILRFPQRLKLSSLWLSYLSQQYM